MCILSQFQTDSKHFWFWKRFFYILRLPLSAHKNRLSEFVSIGHYEKFLSWFQSIGSSSKFQIKIDSPTKVVFRCVNIVCLWTHDIIWITQKHNKVFWNYFIIWYYVGLFITSFILNYCLISLTIEFNFQKDRIEVEMIEQQHYICISQEQYDGNCVESDFM